MPSFSLQFDEITWPFALALASLCLAVVMTDVGRAGETSWVIWAGDLGLTALGLFAVLAENPMTLLIGWALVDVVELGILLRQVEHPATRRRVFYFFATSVLGTISVLGGVIAAGSVGLDLSFSTIPSQAQLFLVLAAGLRMGVFPLQVAFLKEVHHLRGQGTLLRLIPPATSMPLLAYAAFTPVSPAWRFPLLSLSVLAALYGGIAWARARDELQGRIFWIIGMAGMAFVGTLQFRPEAAMAWGLAMLYGGAALFLATVRTRWMVAIGIFGMLMISALPFSPTYSGLTMYSPFKFYYDLGPSSTCSPFTWLPASFLAADRAFERCGALGECNLPGWVDSAPSHLSGINIFCSCDSRQLGIPHYGLSWQHLGWLCWYGVLYWRKLNFPLDIFNLLDKVFSLKWVYSLVGWVYEAFGRVASEISLLIEGEGGVLWTLVLLVLLVSIFSEISSGAGAV